MSVKTCQVLLVSVAILLATPLPLDACTIFNSTEGTRTLVGSNEDNTRNSPKIHFEPAGGGNFAYMEIFNCGSCDPDDAYTASMGGVNDQGLFFDWNSLVTEDRPGNHPDPLKDTYNGYLAREILRTCADIPCVLSMYERYNEPNFATNQIHWVDKSGASVVCGYGRIKEELPEEVIVAFGYVPKSGPFQVSTNFSLLHKNRQDPEIETEVPPATSRYNTTVTELTNWRNLSITKASYILLLVDQTSTIYSYVYDPTAGTTATKKGIVYFFNARDFNNVATVDIYTGTQSHDTLDIATGLSYVARSTALDPQPSALTPANLAVDVSSTANLVLTFPESVSKTSSGYIKIWECFADEEVDLPFESIPITSGKVTIPNGFGTTVTINPQGTFTSGAKYYVKIDPTCLVDGQGMYYHGMPSTQSWRFEIAP
ncbi:MAG: Ig-like domain-containing protein [Acidobacteriota bacterium]